MIITELYHYCSVETMEKIIINKELWLSNILKSNDKKEFKDFDEILSNVIQDIISNVDQIISQSSSKEKAEEVVNFLIAFSNRTQGFMTTQKDKSFIPYVCCFSTEDDDLEQWVKYSKNGTGVCLKFNMSEMSDIEHIDFEKKYSKEDLLGVKVGEVLYKDSKKKELLAEIIIKACRDIINSSKGSTDDLDKIELSKLYTKLFFCSTLFKSHYFQNENERRLFCLADTEGKIEPYPRNFSFTNNGVKGYLKFAIEPSKVITEVTLGPKCQIDKDDAELKLFFKQNNLENIKIRKSIIPYC